MQNTFLLQLVLFNGHCPEGIGRHDVKISVLLSCHIFKGSYWSKEECFIEGVIEVDDLNKGIISAALGKQDK